MNLDTFIQEIEERKTKKINLLDMTLAEKKARLGSEIKGKKNPL